MVNEWIIGPKVMHFLTCILSQRKKFLFRKEKKIAKNHENGIKFAQTLYSSLNSLTTALN